MQSPKQVRFRKHHKSRTKSFSSNNDIINFGKYAIKSCSSIRLKASTIEAVRRVITRKLKRTGQVWVRVNPTLAVSEKPLQSRMGKGKGSLAYWACRVKAGQILYEMDGIDSRLAKEAWRLGDSKLPVKSSFVTLDS